MTMDVSNIPKIPGLEFKPPELCTCGKPISVSTINSFFANFDPKKNNEKVTREFCKKNGIIRYCCMNNLFNLSYILKPPDLDSTLLDDFNDRFDLTSYEKSIEILKSNIPDKEKLQKLNIEFLNLDLENPSTLEQAEQLLETVTPEHIPVEGKRSVPSSVAIPSIVRENTFFDYINNKAKEFLLKFPGIKGETLDADKLLTKIFIQKYSHKNFIEPKCTVKASDSECEETLTKLEQLRLLDYKDWNFKLPESTLLLLDDFKELQDIRQLGITDYTPRKRLSAEFVLKVLKNKDRISKTNIQKINYFLDYFQINMTLELKNIIQKYSLSPDIDSVLLCLRHHLKYKKTVEEFEKLDEFEKIKSSGPLEYYLNKSLTYMISGNPDIYEDTEVPENSDEELESPKNFDY